MSYDQIKATLISWWPKDGDKDIAHAAWASTFDVEKALLKTDEDINRVVQQIVQNAHDTPKEGVWLKFFVSCPLFCERQYDKYRMCVQAQDFQIEWWEAPMGRDHITQNELSGRYRTIPERYYELSKDVKLILKEIEVLNKISWDIVDDYNDILAQQYSVYKESLAMFPAEWKKAGHPRNADYKRCREVLRGVLGTSFITDMRLCMNLNAFEHIINQRLSDSQTESRVLAYKMLKEVMDKNVAPVAIGKMLNVNGWDKYCDEIEKLIA